MDARIGFSYLTVTSIASLYALLLWGILDSERPRAPTVSALIADDVKKLLLYGFYASAFVIGRTALVFTSTFYVIPTKRKGKFWKLVSDRRFAYAAAFFGSLQLTGIILVGMINLNLHPNEHFAVVILLCVGAFICELMLILRRAASQHVSHKWFGVVPDLAVNGILWVGMVVSLTVFAGITMADWYAEITTYVGLAEWIGLLIMPLLNVYRQDDVMHEEKKCKCNEYAFLKN